MNFFFDVSEVDHIHAETDISHTECDWVIETKKPFIGHISFSFQAHLTSTTIDNLTSCFRRFRQTK